MPCDSFPPHPLADAAAECGGPATCDACAMELLRVEAGPCTQAEVVTVTAPCKESAT